MKSRPMADQAAYWTLAICCFLSLTQVNAYGKFELHLQSFRNDKGLNKDGNCCNGYRVQGTCSSQCRTYFRVCLTHYQAAIATDPNLQCTFGEYTSTVVAGNSINFANASDLTMDNPVRFNFTVYTWPGDFSLIVEAWHDSTLNDSTQGSPPELISRLAVQRSAVGGSDWYNSRYLTRFSELVYSYRFKCDEHYFGDTCEDLCRRRDDQFGHYYCSENGTKVCLDGWQGDYCDSALCLPGCHADNGFCDLPHQCKCRVGWRGKYCDSCIPYPGCQHGTCSTKPYWECNCDEGWGGLFCNQDLNYCTRHRPCRNGGTCTNTGDGSYTCACLPGFNGTDCEQEIDHCEDTPCLHGATCQNQEDGYLCSCPQGYFGQHCEEEANHCRPTTCHNGGTCVDHEGSYQCQCRQGYGGFHCEMETGGCKADSCKNGGQCVNEVCICAAGFYGPTCEDDGHNFCLHDPCENGGSCVDLVKDFKCRCVPGYVGNTCAINVDDCEMRPCANGGRCSDLVNDFVCECKPGWTGKDCSVNVDNCLFQPCQHGGTCLDRIDDYECQCPEGYWGKDCQLYEGMSTSPTPAPSTEAPAKTPSVRPTEPAAATTPLHHPSNISGQASRSGDGGKEELSGEQLLVVVCLGAGLPILLIIVVVVVCLCRKCRHNRLPSMDKEIRQNYINNINNHRPAAVADHPGKMLDYEDKCLEKEEVGVSGSLVSGMRRPDSKVGHSGGSSGIFTTGPPLPPVLPSSASTVKISNEEQQDINRLNSQQHQAARDKASRKNFIRDQMGGPEPPYPSPPLPPCRDSYVYDIEKPIRRLDVDSLPEDTKMDISAYHRHSGDISIIVQSKMPPPLPERAERDNVCRSLYLEPTLSKQHAHYTEDYLATEV